MAERLWLCTQCEIIWQGHWNNALNKTGSAHRRAQFISGHLNILFKVLRSCNLVVPLQQAGGLGSLSEDGGAREQPHTTMANQPLQQPCFCQVQFNSPWSFYSLWCLLVPATVKCSSPKRRHSLACLFIYFHRLSVSGDRVWNKVRVFFAGLAWSSANQARSSFFFFLSFLSRCIFSPSKQRGKTSRKHSEMMMLETSNACPWCAALATESFSTHSPADQWLSDLIKITGRTNRRVHHRPSKIVVRLWERCVEGTFPVRDVASVQLIWGHRETVEVKKADREWLEMTYNENM